MYIYIFGNVKATGILSVGRIILHDFKRLPFSCMNLSCTINLNLMLLLLYIYICRLNV